MCHVYGHTYMHLSICIYVCVYIYIYIERERDAYVIYTKDVHLHVALALGEVHGAELHGALPQPGLRGEDEGLTLRNRQKPRYSM